MKKSLLLSFVFLSCLSAKMNAQCLPCGTGADGAFNPTQDTIIAGGTYNFSSFTINAGITVTDTGVLPLVVHCTGDVTINGTLNGSGGNGADGVTFSNAGTGGKAGAGGNNGGDGTYAVATGPVSGFDGLGQGAGGAGMAWSGGGGAGYSAVGMDAGPGVGLGGVMYGSVEVITLDGGSGGAGGSGGYQCGAGGGGAGGGVIQIGACGNMTIGAAGMVLANGGNGGSDGTGNCGGGGAGSGGTIWLSATTITNNGQISAITGTGGASNLPGAPYYGTGGNGADGRIRLDYTTLNGAGTVAPASGYSSHITLAFADSNVLCAGGMTGKAVVTPSGGVAPYTYVWSNGPTDSLNTGLAAGNYAVTVTDPEGCEVTDTAHITEPVATVLTMSSTNATMGNNGTASVAVTGGTAPYTYAWHPGTGTTAAITGLAAGLYTVTVTDAHGCITTDTVRIISTLGVSLQNTNADINVYPNPATDVLNIAMTLTSNKDVAIAFIDYTGRVLKTASYKAVAGKNIYSIPVTSYASGNYFIKIITNDFVQNIPVSIIK